MSESTDQKQHKLLIAKSSFDTLGIDVRTLYKKNIVQELSNAFEFHFDSNEEARKFYTDIVHQSQKIGKFDIRPIEEIGYYIRNYYNDISI